MFINYRNDVIHQQEKQQFKELFKQQKIDRFEERYKILEVFLQTEKHITLRELIELLQQNGYDFEPDLVKDTLKLICDFGFASKISFKDEEPRYEHRHLGHHHDHLICTKCNKIIEFECGRIENLQSKITRSQDFHILQHKMEIYGICGDCLKKRARYQISLLSGKPGERFVIKEFLGGRGAQMRLISMGLRVGDKLEIITNSSGGQVVVAAEGKRYALGYGLAGKIIVQQISHNLKINCKRGL